MLHFIYFFSTNLSTEYFKHAAHSPFFSSKCRLFHNATFFCSCIIHILHTGVLNLNVKLRCQKVKERRGYSRLKEETLDRIMWRARFGRGFGPVVRQTAK